MRCVKFCVNSLIYLWDAILSTCAHNHRQRHHKVGVTEVRWRPGQETSLAPPYSNLRPLGSKCTVLKKVLVHDVVGTFRCLPAIRRPGNCAPFAPSLHPLCENCHNLRNIVLNCIGIRFHFPHGVWSPFLEAYLASLNSGSVPKVSTARSLHLKENNRREIFDQHHHRQQIR